MKTLNFSANYTVGDPTTVPIYLFTQSFVHPNGKRNRELKKALQLNVKSNLFNKIYLLSETQYYHGSVPQNVEEHIIGKKLSIKDIFDFIVTNKISGYIVISHADISFNNSLLNIRKTKLHLERKMFGLLRYEFDYENSTVFGPAFDVQNAWIIHSNKITSIYSSNNLKMFDGMELWKPFFSPKLLYLMQFFAIDIINDPSFIQIFHHHASGIREQQIRDPTCHIPGPYVYVFPSKVCKMFTSETFNTGLIPSDCIEELSSFMTKIKRGTLEVPMQDYAMLSNNFTLYKWTDNNHLGYFVGSHIKQEKQFVLPQISGCETELSVLMKEKGTTIGPKALKQIKELSTMIGIYTDESMPNSELCLKCKDFSDKFLQSFEQCEQMLTWDPYSVITKYSSLKYSHEYLLKTYNTKRPIWIQALAIQNFVYNNPWTFALKEKRILIVSPFAHEICSQVETYELKEFYGIDLFPQCSLSVIQFSTYNDDFVLQLNDLASEDKYDIALVSVPVHGNIICSDIFNSGKSSINIGNTLPMYFGLYNSELLSENSHLIRKFINNSWKIMK